MLRILVIAASVLIATNASMAQCKDPRFCTTQAELDKQRKEAAGEKALKSAVDNYIAQSGHAGSSNLPEKDPANEIAKAIDRQTWEQRFSDDQRNYEMSKQTDALNRIDDSIKLQSLVTGRPFY